MKKVITIFLVSLFLVVFPLSAFAEAEEQATPEITETVTETIAEETTTDEDTIIYDSIDYSLQLEVLHNDLQQTITAIMVSNFIMCVCLSIYLFRIFI